MQVRDLMTVEVFSVRTDTAVSDIARLMSKHHVSGVPVLGTEGELVGIVTELDLIVRNGRLEMPVFALSRVSSKTQTPVVSLPVPAVVGIAISGLSGPGTGRPFPTGGFT